jgi:hypothetical protein
MIRPIVGPAITKQQLSIKDPENETPKLVVFPNPASNVINYRYNHPEQIKRIVIYDIYGKQVLQQQPNSTSELLLHGISPGVYFIHFEIESYPAGITTKVIIY